MTPLLVDTAAAAELLAISPRMLRQLEARGELPSVRIGRLVRYSPAALAAWITEPKENDRHHEPVAVASGGHGRARQSES